MVLFGSMVLSMGLTFVSSVITARLLGPVNYGDLKYIQTVWSLMTLFGTFGLFYSGSRVLVLEGGVGEFRRIAGTMLFISIVIGVLICLATMMLAYPLDHLFRVDAARIMVPLAPLMVALPLSQSLPLILQSTNQIYVLSVFMSVPSVIYMLLVWLLAATGQISTGAVLLAQQLASVVVIVGVVIFIKPSMRSMDIWWREIKRHHRTYGLPVYRGGLASTGTDYLNRLAISYWVDNRAIGFFSLATSLVEPLKLLPNAIATSSFRSFATRQRISGRVFMATVVFSVVSFALAIAFFGKPLSWIYTTRFNEVGPMARALAVGAILGGFGDLFNRFLGAHGRGRSLQNAAYANGIANVAGIVVLVPLFGAWGAVTSAIVAACVYFVKMYVSYRRFKPTAVAG